MSEVSEVYGQFAESLRRTQEEHAENLRRHAKLIKKICPSILKPQSYFVSKLPREYDRKTMAEAFGITDEMMQRTLRFRIGDWLLVSFDATGLVNVPMPVHVPNANERILEHLSEHE